jgi:CNT family concentrative nucleoside transporter
MPFANILGVIVILAIAYGLSSNRKAINVKTAGRTLGLQFLIALLILAVPGSPAIMAKISTGVTNVIQFANEGTSFVFGPLADPSNGFILFTQVFPIIIFIATVFAILFHLRIMDLIIKTLGGAVRWVTGASRLESTVSAASIFVGMVEAPLAILPYLKKMTHSQLFTVMSCGLASIAGTVLIAYTALGVRLDLLLTASFMAAPGGLLMGKLLVPETEEPYDITSFKDAQSDEDRASNVIEAATKGAITGLTIMMNVIALIIAFVAVIALINGIFGGIGKLIGFPQLSLEYIFGLIFAPIAWLIGVPWDEAFKAGPFLGQKLVANEFLAYLNFTKVMGEFSDQGQIAITVALCGFANFVGVGMLIAGLGAVVPERQKEISGLAMKSLVAGTLSNFMSAALVGIAIAFASAIGTA